MATKLGRVAVAGALILGGGYAVLSMAPSDVDDAVPLELRATVTAGKAAVRWSVGPVNDDTVITSTQPFYRQVGAKPGDLVVIVVKSPNSGIGLEAKITYMRKGGRPITCPGVGSVECSTIVK
jgi:hypothetical protein